MTDFDSIPNPHYMYNVAPDVHNPLIHSGYYAPPRDDLGLILSQDPEALSDETALSRYTEPEHIQSADGESIDSENVSSSESLAYNDVLTGAVPEHANFNIVTYQPYATYKVPKEAVSQFYINYCLVASDKKSEVGERTKDHHPFILSFHKLGVERRMMLHVVQYVQKVLLDNLNADYSILYCIVLADDFDADRIRLHFPNCVVSKDTARLLTEQIIARFMKSTTIPTNPNIAWNKNIFCESTADNMELYKSSMSSSHKMVYQCTVNEKAQMDTLEIFNLSTSSFAKAFDSSKLSSYPSTIWLPIILSRMFNKKHIHQRGVTIRDMSVVKSDEPSKIDQMILTFLDMLDVSRYQDPRKWLTLAKCIRDIYGTNKKKAIQTLKGLRTRKGGKAIDAIVARRLPDVNNSRRDHTLNSDYVINSVVYESSEYGRMSVKTLAWLAAEDSPEAYKQWHRKYVTDQIENSISISLADVAEVIYKTYWLEVMWDSEAKRWYIFRTQSYDETKVDSHKSYRWNEYASDDSFKEMLLKDFVFRMDELSNICREQLNAPNLTQLNKTGINGYINVISGITNQIKGRGLSTIVGSCKTAFNNPGLGKWMDENPNTVGMMGKDTIEFITEGGRLIDFHVRKAKPEDYIMKSLGVGYEKDMDHDSLPVRKAQDLMNKVYPDADVRETINVIFASRLRGKNNEKLVVAMVGESGNNGKSTVEDTVSTAYGDYSVAVPKEIITGTAKSGEGASPVLAQAVGARIIWMNELSDKDKIDGAEMKKISSNSDKVFARKLYENGSQKVVMFTPFLVSNVIPAVQYAGAPERKRMYFFPHDTDFTDDADVYNMTEEEQYRERRFVKNPFIADDKYSIAVGLLWLWINVYLPIYIKSGIKMPEIITLRTQKYWKENDIFALFFNDCMEHTLYPEQRGKRVKQQFAPTDYVHVQQAYERFLAWYEKNYPGKAFTRPDIDKFKTYLGYVLEQPVVTTHFFNVRMRNDFF